MKSKLIVTEQIYIKVTIISPYLDHMPHKTNALNFTQVSDTQTDKNTHVIILFIYFMVNFNLTVMEALQQIDSLSNASLDKPVLGTELR